MTKQLIEALTSSKIYQDYERSFSEATGLPVALRSVDSWQLPWEASLDVPGRFSMPNKQE